MEMPENIGFTGSVVANWLQNIVASLLPNDLNMDYGNAAEESAAFLT